MYPKTFIEVGNTLSQRIMPTVETTTANTLFSLTTSLKENLTQQKLQKQQPQEVFTTDVIKKNTFYIENITQISLPGVINSKIGSGSGISSLDAFDLDSAFAYVPPMERPETLFVTILFLIIFIVGVLGNGTLVIIFFRHRNMRNIPNVYIISLALADLLVVIICVPLAILVYTADSWTFGKLMCQMTEFFKDVSIGVSVFTLTALSGERYRAVVDPLRKIQTKPLTVITAAMIWLLSIMFATPSLVMSDLEHILIDEQTNLTIIICTPFGKQRNNSDIYARYVVVTKALIYYLLPLAIIGVLYLLMAHRLHISAREMPGVQSRCCSQARARRYVARMVVTFVVVFFICFFPYHLFELWFHLNPTAREDFDEFWHTVRIIGFCTYFLNSCLNPVALYCVSGTFRGYFKKYLCCGCFRKQTRQRQHSTATGVHDTSTLNMSVRSASYRASVHLNNTHCTGGGVGGGCMNNTNGLGRTYNHQHHHHHSRSQRRHSIMQHQHNGSSLVVAGGNGVAIGLNNGRLSPKNDLSQSGVILKNKR